jgi:hypothetical protein
VSRLRERKRTFADLLGALFGVDGADALFDLGVAELAEVEDFGALDGGVDHGLERRRGDLSGRLVLVDNLRRRELACTLSKRNDLLTLAGSAASSGFG